ncbi:Aste57867_20338 [Aphanomyces stellatus]|uniref:Aste57867_20338 protein n=1 Tax=Aphanomyces stellatus TaxID=120398 RepID=A0A485LEV8_9STRA|nr:hypothetical protein As57867_020272 [Aphanomyces stellatus]VFT97025.1 Aste57867_20338 [Aphanomyces stellatus]
MLQDALDMLQKFPFMVRHIVATWKGSPSRPLSGGKILLQTAHDEVFDQVVSVLNPSDVVPLLRSPDLPFPAKVSLLTVVASNHSTPEWLDEAYDILEVDFTAHPSALMNMQTLSRRLAGHRMSSTHNTRLRRLLERAPPPTSTSESVNLPPSAVPVCLSALARFEALHPVVWRLYVLKPYQLLARTHCLSLPDVVSLLWEVDSFGTCHLHQPDTATSRVGLSMLLDIAIAAALPHQALVRAMHAACVAPLHTRYHLHRKAMHRIRRPSWIVDAVAEIIATPSTPQTSRHFGIVHTLSLLADICELVYPRDNAMALSSTRSLWDLFLSREDGTSWLRSVLDIATTMESPSNPSTNHRATFVAYVIDVVASVLLSHGASISSGGHVQLPHPNLVEGFAAISVDLWASIIDVCISRSSDGQWMRCLDKDTRVQLIPEVLHHWITRGSTHGFHVAVCIAADLHAIDSSTAQDFADFLVQFDQLEQLVAYAQMTVRALSTRRQVYLMHLLDLCSVHADADTQARLQQWTTESITVASPLLTHSNMLVNYFVQRFGNVDAPSSPPPSSADHLPATHTLWTHCVAHDATFIENIQFGLLQAAAWQHTFSHDTKHAWNVLWTCVAWWTPSSPLEGFMDPLPSALVAYLDPASSSSISSLRLEMHIRRYVEGTAMPHLRPLTRLLVTTMVTQPTWRAEMFAPWWRFAKWLLVNSVLDDLQATLADVGIQHGFFLATLAPDLAWACLLNHPRLCGQLVALALADPDAVDSFVRSLPDQPPPFGLACLIATLLHHPNLPCDQRQAWRTLLHGAWHGSLPSASKSGAACHLSFDHRPFYGFLMVPDGETSSPTTVPLVTLDFAGWLQTMLTCDTLDWQSYGLHMLSEVYLPLQFNGDRFQLVREYVAQVARADQSPPPWLTTCIFSGALHPPCPIGLWMCDVLEHAVAQGGIAPSALQRAIQTLPLLDMVTRTLPLESTDAWPTASDDIDRLWHHASCIFRSPAVAPIVMTLLAGVFCVRPAADVITQAQAMLQATTANRDSLLHAVNLHWMLQYPSECKAFGRSLCR